MKILLVHKFWKNLSGAEVYFHEVRRILKKQGHTVKVFTTNMNAEGGIDPKEENDEIVYGHNVDYLHDSLIQRAFKLPELIYSKNNKKEIAGLLDEFHPDIVHVFAVYVTLTPSVLEACREKNVPVVMSCNDYKHICTNYRLYHHGHVCTDCKGGKLYSSVINNCCKHSFAFSVASCIEAYTHEIKNIYRKNVNTFLFASKFMMNITKEFWENKSHHSLVIGNPFQAPSFTANFDHDNYVLFIGRLSEEKGVDILLKAMQRVPEAKLKIVGTGSEKANLEKLRDESGLENIEFTGAKWGDDAKKMIQRARFVVIPSRWHENFPFVIFESYSMGKAVVGTDRGGIPELILEGETGHVYAADDVNRLSELIRMMWNDETGTIQKGMNAKKYADENFNDEVYYKKLMDAYSFAMQKKPADQVLQ
jgi:glycosyltransferase involved in cell wall biosynthesis